MIKIPPQINSYSAASIATSMLSSRKKPAVAVDAAEALPAPVEDGLVFRFHDGIAKAGLRQAGEDAEITMSLFDSPAARAGKTGEM